MDNYKVYMHIAPNNKKYIGVTKKRVEERWGNNGSHYINHRYFGSAIKKYGWDNFRHIVIAENLSKKWAFQLEKLLIIQYKTKDRRYGYNLSDGGEYNSGFHYKRPPEFIEYMREINTGRHPNAETRKKMSENNAMHRPEIRKKVSESLKKSGKERAEKRKKTMQERYPNGIKQTAESNRKRSEALKGKPKSEATKQKMRKPKSPEAIENMRKAQKEAWKRRKEREKEN